MKKKTIDSLILILMLCFVGCSSNGSNVVTPGMEIEATPAVTITTVPTCTMAPLPTLTQEPVQTLPQATPSTTSAPTQMVTHVPTESPKVTATPTQVPIPATPGAEYTIVAKNLMLPRIKLEDTVECDLYSRMITVNGKEYAEISLWNREGECWTSEEWLEGDEYYKPYDDSAWDDDNGLIGTELETRGAYWIVDIDNKTCFLRYSLNVYPDDKLANPRLRILEMGVNGPREWVDEADCWFYTKSNCDVPVDVSFPKEDMVAFYEKLYSYCSKGTLIVSTLDGEVNYSGPVDIMGWMSELVLGEHKNFSEQDSIGDYIDMLQASIQEDNSTDMPMLNPVSNKFVTGLYRGEQMGSIMGGFLSIVYKDGQYSMKFLKQNAISVKLNCEYGNGVFLAKGIEDVDLLIEMSVTLENEAVSILVFHGEDSELELLVAGEQFYFEKEKEMIK